jgi:beta-lactamase class D
LPYKKEHIEILKNIMIVEKTLSYTIRAKTGWTKDIGWYVGYVETKDDVWFFALNMDVLDRKQLKYRIEIVMETLRVKEII